MDASDKSTGRSLLGALGVVATAIVAVARSCPSPSTTDDVVRDLRMGTRVAGNFGPTSQKIVKHVVPTTALGRLNNTPVYYPKAVEAAELLIRSRPSGGTIKDLPEELRWSLEAELIKNVHFEQVLREAVLEADATAELAKAGLRESEATELLSGIGGRVVETPLLLDPEHARVWRELPHEDVAWRPILRDPSREVQKSVTAERVAEPQMISLLPHDPLSYRGMYDSPATAAIESEIVTLQSQVAQTPHARQVTFKDIRISSDFSRWLRDELPRRRVAVFIAHSEDDGATLILPTGDRYPAASLHMACVDAGTRCYVLTCFGKDFGITKRIRAKRALSLWVAAIEHHARELASIDPDLFAKTIRRKYRAADAEDKIVLTASLLVPSGAIVWIVEAKPNAETKAEPERGLTSR